VDVKKLEKQEAKIQVGTRSLPLAISTHEKYVQAKIEKRAKRSQLYEGSKLLDQYRKQVNISYLEHSYLDEYHIAAIIRRNVHEGVSFLIGHALPRYTLHVTRLILWNQAVQPNRKAKIFIFLR
jgi:hypothetical protein